MGPHGTRNTGVFLWLYTWFLPHNKHQTHISQVWAGHANESFTKNQRFLSSQKGRGRGTGTARTARAQRPRAQHGTRARLSVRSQPRAERERPGRGKLGQG